MCSKDQVHKTITLLDFLHHRRFLHHTAAEPDHHVGIFLFQGMEIAQPAIYPEIGILPDRTGVINYKIRRFTVAFYVTDFFQYPPELLGIPGIHLAAEGVDAETSSLEDVAHSKTL